MPGFIDKQRERAAARRTVKQRKRSRRAPRAKRRRMRALKAAACIGLLALEALAVFVVGDSDYHATAIGWMPLIMTAAAIVCAWLYVRAMRAGLRFEELSDVHDCPRDSAVAFKVRFRNRTPLFFFHLRAYFFISDQYGNAAHEASTTLALSPREVYELSFSTKFDHIGVYEAGLDRVEIGDFLNLFTATVIARRHARVSVTPKLQSIDRVQFDTETADEDTLSAKSHLADSMDYAYVREYEPGDPLKTIHWKLSARSQTYMTRLYEVHANPSVAVILSFYAAETDSDLLMGMFDAVVECGLSLAEYARRQGMEVQVRYADRKGEPVALTSWEKGDLARIVAGMPAMTDDPAQASKALDLVRDEALGRHGASNLIVCTADLSAEMVSTVIEAKGHRRSPALVAVVPRNLVGREVDAHCASLAPLDAADVPYVAVSRSDDLKGVRL